MLITNLLIFETKPHGNTGDNSTGDRYLNVTGFIFLFFSLHSLLCSIKGEKIGAKLYFNPFAFHPGLQWYPTSRRKGEDHLGQI